MRRKDNNSLAIAATNLMSRAELMASGINGDGLPPVPSPDPDRLLSLLGVDEMLEIGDEVTVPSSPLMSTFQSYTDHSYFSSSRLETPPSGLRFSDCVSESSLAEFHELFDLTSEYQPFDLMPGESIGLQEQVIDSNSGTMDSAGFQNQIWMQSGDGDSRESGGESVDNEIESSSSSSEADTDKSQEVEKERKKITRPHHTGPFPHTFIALPGDRRLRFCFGLQTIVTKIRALMSRTGSTADFRADFEGHVFTLENVDKLLRFSNRSQKPKPRKSEAPPEKSHNPTPCEANNLGADDDHRYAATILTQSESSSTVRDHQYNEISTMDSVSNRGNRKKPIQKSYIRTRYARERWLRKCAATIYSKMQRLINRTGAKMTLRINYEDLVITQKNYKDLEYLLGKYRPSMKKFNSKISVQKQNHDGDEESSTCPHSPPQDQQTEHIPENQSGTLMKVSYRPALNHSLQVEVLQNLAVSPSRLLQTVVESDHDYDNQVTSTRSSPRIPSRLECPLPLSLFESGHGLEMGNDEFRVFSLPQEDPNLPPKTSSSSSSSLLSPAVEFTRRADASTNTEATCGVCGHFESVGNTLSVLPQWIRCANPLCYYLVHPACIGFFVTSPQHLQFLPPYFCPDHRNLTS